MWVETFDQACSTVAVVVAEIAIVVVVVVEMLVG